MGDVFDEMEIRDSTPPSPEDQEILLKFDEVVRAYLVRLEEEDFPNPVGLRGALGSPQYPTRFRFGPISDQHEVALVSAPIPTWQVARVDTFSYPGSSAQRTSQETLFGCDAGRFWGRIPPGRGDLLLTSLTQAMHGWLKSMRTDNRPALQKAIDDLSSQRREEALAAGAGLAAIGDPTERLLRGMWLYTHHTGVNGFDQISAYDRRIVCDEPALREAFPRLWPAGRKMSLGSNPPWDSHAIAQWFIRHVQGQPRNPHLLVERPGIFGYRQQRVPGWAFSNGSTFRVRRGDTTDFSHISVTTEGEILFGSSPTPLQPGEGFNAHALRQMATDCGFGASTATPAPPAPLSRAPYDEYAGMKLQYELLAKSDESPLCHSRWTSAN